LPPGGRGSVGEAGPLAVGVMSRSAAPVSPVVAPVLAPVVAVLDDGRRGDDPRGATDGCTHHAGPADASWSQRHPSALLLVVVRLDGSQ
jgi:hypothetical protein